MEKILRVASQEVYTVLSIDIADVGGGPATLYVLDGGMQPPMPHVGDFSYDFANHTFNVYYSSGWKNIMMYDVISLVHHPNGKPSIISLTLGALPYWMPGGDKDTIEIPFRTVHEVLAHFKNTFDVNKVKAAKFPRMGSKPHHCSSLHSHNLNVVIQRDSLEKFVKKIPKVPEWNFLDKVSVVGYILPVPGFNKTERTCANATVGTLHVIDGKNDPSRFTSSSIGFPEGSERIRWHAGYETFIPFAGKGCNEDSEGVLVTMLSRHASLERSRSERCGPEPRAFRVQDLIVEIQLDPILQDPKDKEEDEVEHAWKLFLSEIRSYMAQSTSVVIRGWTPALSMRFSKAFMSLQFGNLGQRCQWIDGVRFAANRDSPEDLVYHEVTTLQKFVDLVKDSNTCGNFLDAKDVNPSPPMWMAPLLDSTMAWNHTMHLRFTPARKTKRNKNKAPAAVVEQQTPSVIRSGTWTSQGWRLVTHPGFVTFPHHDCCGLCTYVIGNCGAKIWGVVRPKRDICPNSSENIADIFRRATDQDDQGNFSNADIATVCLEDGDVMFQPPGVLHCVYTPVPSIFSGGYFFSYETMHLTRIVLSLKGEDSLTNDERPGFLRTLCRMLIALRYRSEPRNIGKRSLVSLMLIVLDHAKCGECKENQKDTSVLGKEETGELAFAVDTAKRLLKWMNMTAQEAKQFVDTQGPYYSGGSERVQIPALTEGVMDPIFPDMNGLS